jgi:hypothetical protein
MSAGVVRADDITPLKRWIWWAGWLLSALGLFVLLTSVRWKLTRQPFYVAEWRRIGYPENALLGIGLLQLTCVVLYVIPRTAVLGMVLLTGYLGGAIASYVRMQEPNPVLVPLTTALLLWAGLYLREERLRSLLPFRTKTARE